VHYAEDAEVSTESPKLTDTQLVTTAMRVAFLAVDRSRRLPSAAPYIWSNQIKIQHRLDPQFGNERVVTLFALPSSEEIRYTLNGAEPRDGIPYTGPFPIDGDRYRLLVFAEDKGISAKEDFQIPKGISESGSGDSQGGPPVADPPLTKPVIFPTDRKVTINARDKVFSALDMARDRQMTFSWVEVSIAEGQATARLQFDIEGLGAEQLRALAESLIVTLPPTASLTFKFGAMSFPSGQDLLDFAAATGVSIASAWKEHA